MKKQLLKLFNEAGFHQPEMERLIVEHKFEKFAESIVKECARIVTDAVDHCKPASTYADKIKEHFGVEE
jgi:6-phosphogluconate dehydrogenase